jgi:zinc transport system substrate-binding protein
MFRTVRQFAYFLAVLALFAAEATLSYAAPNVVVSIAPVHSLVAGVMAGVGESKLLVPANASPHAFSLRPSNARALARADIVFHVGGGLEPFLDKPLRALVSGAAVTLVLDQGIIVRQIEADHDDRAVSVSEQGHKHDYTIDPHIWLSLHNARRIATIAAQILSDRDPQNAGAYAANLAVLNSRFDTLQRELTGLLTPVRAVPYVVLHEAYRYLEVDFSLRHVAAITTLPEHRPGARQLHDIRNLLAAQDIRCVFAEPQFPSAITNTVVEGTNARLAKLDPLGVGITPGPDLYFTLMENLARSLAECLGN